MSVELVIALINAICQLVPEIESVAPVIRDIIHGKTVTQEQLAALAAATTTLENQAVAAAAAIA